MDDFYFPKKDKGFDDEADFSFGDAQDKITTHEKRKFQANGCAAALLVNNAINGNVLFYHSLLISNFELLGTTQNIIPQATYT